LVSFRFSVTTTAISPNSYPEAGLLVLTSFNAGIFGVSDNGIVNCRSFDVCRVLSKQTAEEDQSEQSVPNQGFTVSIVFAQGALN
jgi:hypothetical protein